MHTNCKDILHLIRQTRMSATKQNEEVQRANGCNVLTSQDIITYTSILIYFELKKKHL